MFLLGIDTCGPSGTVAVGRLTGMLHTLEILDQRELEGRSYSATLVAAVEELLKQRGVRLADIGYRCRQRPGEFYGRACGA
jgi:tRNA threonylcarbamoyladenosine biosynthesis protein TsaB